MNPRGLTPGEHLAVPHNGGPAARSSTGARLPKDRKPAVKQPTLEAGVGAAAAEQSENEEAEVEDVSPVLYLRGHKKW